LTFNTIQIWQSDPVFTSIDDYHFELGNIHFPAVTICPISHVIVGKLMEELCELK
jgi:hypothetical protein